MSDYLFTEPLVQSIGWALVHFIWQGVVIAAAAAALLATMRGGRSSARYAIACGALALMLAAPVATTLRLSSDSVTTVAPAMLAQTGEAGSLQRASVPVRPTTEPAATWWSRVNPDQVVGLGVLAWLVGVAFLSLRLATGWGGVERLRRQAYPLSQSIEARVSHLAARLRITRPVRVLESTAIVVPTLVGWIRPVILLPAGVLSGMPPAHLDAVISHELAHVRRHDYLINVLQALVETLLFYHPAVWWCSRQVRLEREHCCDDLAVEAFGDRLEYATALANLEELRRNDFRLALAATDGQLLDRIRRLLGVRAGHDGRAHLWIAIAVAVTMAVAAASTTLKGASRQTSWAEADVIFGPDSATRQALVHLTARIAHWRGHLFSPQVLPFPPLPPRAPEPPSAPEPPVVPKPPTPPEHAPIADLPEPPAAPEPPLPPFGPEPPAAPEPPLPLLGPEPPAPPEPPPPMPPQAAPAPARPPAPPAPPAPLAITSGPGRNRITWGNRGEQITLEYSGAMTLADDDRDIATMERGAYFRLSEERSRIPLLGAVLGAAREIELRGRSDGTIDRRYSVGLREQAFEPEGRQWLRDFLPFLVRRTGFAAEQRVTRILRRQGAEGVAREIGTLESDFVRTLYVRLLTKQTRLSSSELNQVLQNLTINSDFEMAQALIALAETQTIDASGPAFFRAARTINSDFELRRALTPLLERTRDAAFSREVFATSEDINSDFEQAAFLRAAASAGLMEQAPDAFFDALVNVGSDFEHRRVLDEVVRRAKGDATVRRLFQSAGRINSDHEQANFLRDAAAAGLVEQGRDAFFGAAATIGSDFERRRALTAVVQRPNVPAETLEGVVRSASDIGSDFEQAELLLEIARRHRVEGRLRERMLDLVESSISSEHERGRVLAAVLRSERAAR